MSRRACQYRQGPRWCNSNNSNSDRVQSPEDGLSQAPSIASLSSSAASAKKTPKAIGSSTFLRQQVATTSFAAAVSPTSSAIAVGKGSLMRTNSMPSSSSTPLLGGPSQPKKKASRRSQGSFSPTTPLSRKQKRKSISKSICAPLKNVSSTLARVSSKVKRGYKPSSTKHLPSDSNKNRYIENTSQTTSSGSTGSTNHKSTLESIDKLDADYLHAPEKYEKHSGSLKFEKNINTDTRLTPLEFDEAKVTNHFRRNQDAAAPLPVQLREIDFSLNHVLTHNSSSEISDEDDEGYMKFLQAVGAVSGPSTFDAPSMPLLEVADDCSSLGDSDHSIPSLSMDPDAPAHAEMVANIQVPEDGINKDEAADSALAWGCMTALLGSPAPQSVLGEAKKRRVSVNLWQGDNEAMLDDLDGVLSLPQDDLPLQECSGHSHEEKNKIDFNRALEKALSSRHSGRPSTPEAFYDSYLFHESKINRKKNEENPVSKQGDGVYRDECMQCDDSSHSIPEIACEEEGNAVACDHSRNAEIVLSGESQVVSVNAGTVFQKVGSCHELGVSAMNLSQDASDVEEAADSTLLWGCLSALLGAPAPELVAKRKKREPINLWVGDDEGGDLDDLLSLPTGDLEGVSVLMGEMQESDVSLDEGIDDLSDHCSIPSLSSNQEQLDRDIISDMDGSSKLAFASSAPASSKPCGKHVADSTLAWSALTAILGSPAPALRKTAPKKHVNLWDCDVESHLIPEIDEQESVLSDCGNESDSHGIPSIDELVDTNEGISFGIDNLDNGKYSKKEAADSTLAWGALGMLLGSPAPELASKKKRKASEETKNLWDDYGAMGDDRLDTIPDMHLEEDATDSIPSPHVTIKSEPSSVKQISFLPDTAAKIALSDIRDAQQLGSDGELWMILV